MCGFYMLCRVCVPCCSLRLTLRLCLECWSVSAFYLVCVCLLGRLCILCGREKHTLTMHLTLWYIVFVCHQNYVCQDSIGSVYVGGYCGLDENELCVIGKLCPVGCVCLLGRKLCSYRVLQCLFAQWKPFEWTPLLRCYLICAVPSL